MRLPWNKKYMEIGFHVIVTVLILAGMAALLFWLPRAKNVIFETAGNLLAVFAPFFWALFFSLLLEPLTAFWQGFYEKRCSLYHRSRDIFELINFTRDNYPDYKLYLRRLRCLPAWEIDLICVK